MLTLSIRQPWAWTIVNGHKSVENRNWATKHRGEILIHASKTFDREGYYWIRQQFPNLPLPPIGSYHLGGIVGKARLTDCVEDHPSPWFFGEYGFVLDRAQPLPFMPVNGQLGFFNIEYREGHHAVA
ncbi:MAG: ASCH domain-containing protein [Micavibrio sp.]